MSRWCTYSTNSGTAKEHGFWTFNSKSLKIYCRNHGTQKFANIGELLTHQTSNPVVAKFKKRAHFNWENLNRLTKLLFWDPHKSCSTGGFTYSMMFTGKENHSTRNCRKQNYRTEISRRFHGRAKRRNGGNGSKIQYEWIFICLFHEQTSPDQVYTFFFGFTSTQTADNQI